MTRSATSRRTKQTSVAVPAAQAESPSLSAHAPDLQIPFSSQALFWRPRHLISSPALGQLPFLFWLLGTIRPRTIVQLGVGDGLLYMGLCQTSERLGDSAICLGIQADEPLMPPDLRIQHDAQYSDFSQLCVGSSSVIAQRFDDEIDLLVLNQVLDAEALAQLQSDWLPHLSDRAVILICHPDGIFPDAAAREIVFPRKGRSMVVEPASTGSHAMEVILYGKNQAERLLALAAQRAGKPAYLAARQVFNRLGQGIEAIYRADVLQKERDSFCDALRSAETRLETREKELSAERSEVKAARASEAAEVSRQAELLARLHDLEQELSEKNRGAVTLLGERDHFKSKLELLEERSKAREAEHEAELGSVRLRGEAEAAALKSEIETLGVEKAALDAEQADTRAVQSSRIAALEEQCKAREAELEAMRSRGDAEAAALKSEIETLGAARAALDAELADTRATQQSRIAALEQQFQMKEAELEAMRSQRSAEAAALKLEIQSLGAERAVLNVELADIKAQQQSRIAMLEENSKLRAVEHQAELEATRSRRDGEAAALKSEIETLEAERAALNAELGDTKARQQSRIVMLEEQLAAREAELEAARLQGEAEAAALKSDIEALEAERTALHTELAEASMTQQSGIAMLEENSRLRAAEHEAEMEVVRLQWEAEAAALKSDIEALETERAALHAELADAKHEHAERIQDIVILTANHETEQKKLRSASDKTQEALQKQLEQMHGKLKDLEDRSNAREAELEAARSREQTEAAAAKKSDLDKHALQSTHDLALKALQKQLEQTRSRLGAAEDRVKAIETERKSEQSRSRKEVVALRSEIEPLAAAKAAAEARLAKVQAEHEARIEDIVVLTKKYNSEKQELQAKHDRASKASGQQMKDVQAQLAQLEKDSQTKLAQLEEEVTRIKTNAGVEVGRIVKALLPNNKGGVWKKAVPVREQAKILVDSQIVDPQWYLVQHPDVAAAGMDPALHYVLHGATEGRIARRILD